MSKSNGTTIWLQKDTLDRLNELKILGGYRSYNELFKVSFPVMESRAKMLSLARLYFHMNPEEELKEKELQEKEKELQRKADLFFTTNTVPGATED